MYDNHINTNLKITEAFVIINQDKTVVITKMKNTIAG